MADLCIRKLREREIDTPHYGQSIGDNNNPTTHTENSLSTGVPTARTAVEEVSNVLQRHGIALTPQLLDPFALVIPHATPGMGLIGVIDDENTVHVVPDPFSQLTAAAVQDVRKTFLADTPSWRVLFSGFDPECNIICYAGSVAIPDFAFDSDLKAALATLVSRDNSLRSLTLELEHHQLIEALRTASEFATKQYRMPCLLRQHAGRLGMTRLQSAWIFHGGATYSDFATLPEWVSIGNKFAIANDGSYHRVYRCPSSHRYGFLVEAMVDVPANQKVTPLIAGQKDERGNG